MKCTSCGKDVRARSNFVRFQCPSCNETEIIRCSTCKTLSRKYKCSSCGFIGP